MCIYFENYTLNAFITTVNLNINIIPNFKLTVGLFLI